MALIVCHGRSAILAAAFCKLMIPRRKMGLDQNQPVWRVSADESASGPQLSREEIETILAQIDFIGATTPDGFEYLGKVYALVEGHGLNWEQFHRQAVAALWPMER
ncbi:MAG TPA: hypothetical protein VF443_13435 [Nitrospira sp.]